MEITETIRNFIIENSYVDKNNLNESTLVFYQGILDSMGFLKLTTFIENAFHIKLLDEDLTEENFESIYAISSFIRKKLEKKEGE